MLIVNIPVETIALERKPVMIIIKNNTLVERHNDNV